MLVPLQVYAFHLAQPLCDRRRTEATEASERQRVLARGCVAARDNRVGGVTTSKVLRLAGPIRASNVTTLPSENSTFVKKTSWHSRVSSSTNGARNSRRNVGSRILHRFRSEILPVALSILARPAAARGIRSEVPSLHRLRISMWSPVAETLLCQLQRAKRHRPANARNTKPMRRQRRIVALVPTLFPLRR